MAEHIALKKVLGSSDQSVGAARRARPSGRFRPVLVGKNRDRHRAIHPLAGVRASKFYDWRERYGRVMDHPLDEQRLGNDGTEAHFCVGVGSTCSLPLLLAVDSHARLWRIVILPAIGHVTLLHLLSLCDSF
jgi:hypothetical protein